MEARFIIARRYQMYENDHKQDKGILKLCTRFVYYLGVLP